MWSSQLPNKQWNPANLNSENSNPWKLEQDPISLDPFIYVIYY